MKDNQKKRDFITARAEGKSYSKIAKELGISKSTCTEWSKALKEEIADLKEAQREEMRETYKIQREARIKAHRDILEKIDQAISKINYEELSPRELLSLRLQYARELKEEYTEPIEIVTDNTLQGILEQYQILYREAGKLSPADLKARLEVLKTRETALKEMGVIAENVYNSFSIREPKGLTYEDVVLKGKIPGEDQEAGA